MELWRWIELLLGTGLGSSGTVAGVLGLVKWLRSKRLLTGKVKNAMGYQLCPVVTLGMIKPMNLQSHSNDSYHSVMYGLIWKQRNDHNWSSKMSFPKSLCCLLVAHGSSGSMPAAGWNGSMCWERETPLPCFRASFELSASHPTCLGLDS